MSGHLNEVKLVLIYIFLPQQNCRPSSLWYSYRFRMIDYFSIAVVVFVGLVDMTVLMMLELDFEPCELKIDSKQPDWTFEY